MGSTGLDSGYERREGVILLVFFSLNFNLRVGDDWRIGDKQVQLIEIGNIGYAICASSRLEIWFVVLSCSCLLAPGLGWMDWGSRWVMVGDARVGLQFGGGEELLRSRDLACHGFLLYNYGDGVDDLISWLVAIHLYGKQKE
jgi:hypothetical protein